MDIWEKGMNKKGAFSAGFVFALFLLVVAVLFFVGGGASSILGIVNVLKEIPAWVWVIFIVIFVFKRWGK